MMDPSERAIPGVSANYLMMEAMARYRFAKKNTSKVKRILDVACGTGYGTAIVSGKGKEVYGIDLNTEAISFARTSYQNDNTSFFVGDVYDIPFKDMYFDAIIAFEMIEHLEHLNVFLKEAQRVLKKNGTLIVSTPNRLITSPDGNLMSPYHTQEYDPDQLKRLLGKHFKDVTVLGQQSSSRALTAHHDFMKSQTARQSFVDIDLLSIRKLIPRPVKEHIWKRAGSLFGRKTQDLLTEADFPIQKYNVSSAQYLVALCKK